MSKTVQKNTPIINAIVCGLVSSGRSTFINALSNCLLAAASKTRQTSKPIMYCLRENGSNRNVVMIAKTLDKHITANKKLFENEIPSGNKLEEILGSVDKTYLRYPVKSKLNINLVNFPGFGDRCDRSNMFFKSFNCILPNYDLVFYVCNANNPFLTDFEVDNIKTILSEIENIRQNHNIDIELFIIAAKYDDEDNKELFDMYKNIPEVTGVPKENIFRVNSYQVLVTHMKKKIFVPKSFEQEIKNIKSNLFGKIRGKKKLPVLGKVINSSELFGTDKFEEDGDWDNLFERIKSFENELNELRSMSRTKSLINILHKLKTTDSNQSISQFNIFSEELVYFDQHYSETLNYFKIMKTILNIFLETTDVYKLSYLQKYVSSKKYIKCYIGKNKKKFTNSVMGHIDKLLKKDINKYISFLPSNVNYGSEENKYLLLKNYLIANPEYINITYVKNTFSFRKKQYQNVINVFYMSKAMLRSLIKIDMILLTANLSISLKRNIETFKNSSGSSSKHIGVDLFTNCLRQYYNENDKKYLDLLL
jgi:hypothetical protein